MFKKTIALLLVVSLISLVACSPAATSAPAEEKDVFTVALILPGPRGDLSFIDAIALGGDKANEQLSDVKVDIIEPKGVTEMEPAIRTAIAKGYDLIIGNTVDIDTMNALALEFPDQKFVEATGSFVEPMPTNLAVYGLNVADGSFLGGIIAGSLTKTKIIGAVVGGDSPGMNTFTYGYKQGMLVACPDCTLLVNFLGFEFNNPTLGKEAALSQFQLGADIIFQVAGGSGAGVLSAADSEGKFALGVDSIQDDLYPGTIITSVLTSMEDTILSIIKNTSEGEWTGGTKVDLGLKDGAGGISWDKGSTTFADNGPADMVEKLPAVKALVDEYRQKVIDGSFEVCISYLDPELTSPVCAPLKLKS